MSNADVYTPYTAPANKTTFVAYTTIETGKGETAEFTQTPYLWVDRDEAEQNAAELVGGKVVKFTLAVESIEVEEGVGDAGRTM